MCILKYTELQFFLFYMGAKLGPSHWERNTGRGLLENRVLRKEFGPEKVEVTGE